MGNSGPELDFMLLRRPIVELSPLLSIGFSASNHVDLLIKSDWNLRIPSQDKTGTQALKKNNKYNSLPVRRIVVYSSGHKFALQELNWKSEYSPTFNMKSTVVSLFPLVASCASLEARQFSSAPVAGIDTLKPRIRQGAQRTLTKFGRKIYLCICTNIIANISKHTPSTARK